MEKDKLITFATQVYLQSTFVWSAGVYLDEAVANKNTHVNRIFFHIQSMMTASANVSKLLWAQDHTKPQRVERQPLRDFFAIDESSALFDRSLRNSFDHLDERLDDWWDTSSNHSLVDRIVGSPSDFKIDGLKNEEFFRAYDPRTATAYFRNKGYSTKILCSEARRLIDIAQKSGL
jgi:hypothetical protein